MAASAQAITSDRGVHNALAAQSHYHNNGFDKIVLLTLKSGAKLRLHIWYGRVGVYTVLLTVWQEAMHIVLTRRLSWRVRHAVTFLLGICPGMLEL